MTNIVILFDDEPVRDIGSFTPELSGGDSPAFPQEEFELTFTLAEPYSPPRRVRRRSMPPGTIGQSPYEPRRRKR